jgi:tRNA threonylcarbamoyladenosine biosynthesis protein TsaE
MMKKILQIKSPEEMIALGQTIGKKLFPGAIITLNGDLGAGKTTFTKGIGQALNIKAVINSPTFTIMKVYQGDLTLFHIDAYRLDGVGSDFDLEEYFYQDGICVIEWAEIITDILPEERLDITISITGESTRQVIIETNNQEYQKLEGIL